MNRPRKHHGERLTLNPFGGMAHALTLGSALGRAMQHRSETPLTTSL